MSSTSAKLVLAPLVLAATWSTAHAADQITATFQANSSPFAIDHTRIFTESYTDDVSTNDGVLISGSPHLSADLGGFSNSTASTFLGSTTVSYAAGTSAYVGLLGTSTDSGSGAKYILASFESGSASDVRNYLASGTNFEDVYGAIISGTTDPLVAFSGDPTPGGTRSFFLPQYTPTQVTNTFAMHTYVFKDIGGVVSTDGIGHGTGSFAINQVVPEPMSLIALGIGLLGLKRRKPTRG